MPAIDKPNTLLENVRSARAALGTDTGIRDWVNSRDDSAIRQLGTPEQIRMINRLMD